MGSHVDREETNMTYAEQLAEFVNLASFDDISGAARMQLKIRILDSLGCAIGAIGSRSSSACSRASGRV